MKIEKITALILIGTAAWLVIYAPDPLAGAHCLIAGILCFFALCVFCNNPK